VFQKKKMAFNPLDVLLNTLRVEHWDNRNELFRTWWQLCELQFQGYRPTGGNTGEFIHLLFGECWQNMEPIINACKSPGDILDLHIAGCLRFDGLVELARSKFYEIVQKGHIDFDRICHRRKVVYTLLGNTSATDFLLICEQFLNLMILLIKNIQRLY